MTGEIWSFAGSVIVGVLTLFGVLYTNNSTRKKTDAIHELQMEQINTSIQKLETAQSKHNSVIERTFILEKNQEAQNRDIKTLYNNLDDIKTDIHEVKGDFEKNANELNELKGNVIRLEVQLNK